MIVIGPEAVFKMTLLTSVFNLIVERMGVLGNLNGKRQKCDVDG